MNNRLFDDLIASIKEAGAIKRNEMKASRVTELELLDIKEVREKISLSRLRIKFLIPFKASKNKPLTLLHKQINREIGKHRIRIEHVNGKLKTFRILAIRYHNRHNRMGLRLNLIAEIYNM